MIPDNLDGFSNVGTVVVTIFSANMTKARSAITTVLS
jgi:hypothetical protein